MPKLPVAFTAQARQHLREIKTHIAHHSPERAVHYLELIRKKCLDLALMPEAYAVMPDFYVEDIRRKPFENYVITYVIKPDRIIVVGIFHAARDYAALLLDEITD